MNPLRMSVLATGLVSTAALAAPNLRQELTNHKIAAELDSMMENASQVELEKRKILTELPERLAAEFLVPFVSRGEFVGNPDTYSYKADIGYAASGNLSSVLGELATALGGARTSGLTLCVSNENQNRRKVIVRNEAADSLHQALGTSTRALSPSTHYVATVGESTLILSEPALGTTLFKMVSKSIEQGGTTRLRLVAQDGKKVSPDDKAAVLVLTTAEGQKLKLEVELSGAKAGLVNSVPEGAEWRVSGSPGKARFAKRRAGHIALLSVMLKQGGLAFRGPEKVVHYPSHFSAVKPPKQRLDVLGADNAWFATTSMNLSGTYEVFRGDGECDTNIVFSGKEMAVGVGPLPDSAWAKATRFKSIRPDLYETELGYLRGPHNFSPPSGISNDDFDDLLGRNEACSEVCLMTENRIRRAYARAMVSDPGINRGLMREFSNNACMSSCMVSRSYRRCLSSSMGITSSINFINEARSCEDRAP